ncbi:Type 2A phosphatase-associated protein 42 [Clarireedia jacksonii]
MTDSSLKSLFDSAERQRLAIESSWSSNTQSYQQDVASTIKIFEDCCKLRDSLSLFSPNEILEDVNSGDLQYIAIEYRIAELYLKLASDDRKLVLHNARKGYESFLALLDQYEMLSQPNKKLYADYLDSPTTFSTISTTDPNARRGAKIANFKLEKELKKKFEFLAQNPAYLQNDEDAVRDLELARLALCAHETFQSLESINRELEVLALAPPVQPSGPESLGADERERLGLQRSDEGYSDRLDLRDITTRNPGPILSTGGKPLRPFTLLENRQTLQKGVFKPGHNLPTMTIDEYLEEERARGNIIEGGGEASGIIPEIDPDDYEKMDEETEKARRWDDFVEENPKGAGNTLNRG